MADTETDKGSPFWRFSLGFYRRPGVADACIALAEAQSICAKADGWRDDVVVPLRTLRRKLKGGSALVEHGTAELFRTKIKAVELESERLQQEALFGLSRGLSTETVPSVEVAARSNVAVYEQAMSRTFTPGDVDVLLGALGRQGAGTG